MAAQSFGAFGAYKYLYSRYQEPDSGEFQTVWVSKRYIPTDLRSTAPVPRHKLMSSSGMPQANPSWVPLGEPSLGMIDRGFEEKEIYASQPSTRAEEWSTLRQVLPSRGRPYRHGPPNWGTGITDPPRLISRQQSRFPHINSPMTRYVDDMHATNRLFKLH
ncbi:uncharacterized protein LOC144453619 [Glandiceps talaboti]